LNEPKAPTGYWGPIVLDNYVAPELSSLKVCFAPDIPDPPSLFGTFLLNDVLIGPVVPTIVRPHTVVFLRRWRNAIEEYRTGRERLVSYVSKLPQTNSISSVFLSALSHFEQCIISGHIAALLLARLVEHATGSKSNPAFTAGDGSVVDRLRVLSNSIKHFDERVVAGKPNEHPAPMWITNDGLKCRPKNGKGPFVDVTFAELAEFLSDLTENAKFLADPTYRTQKAAETAAPNTAP
jgi:hypothetical protein